MAEAQRSYTHFFMSCNSTLHSDSEMCCFNLVLYSTLYVHFIGLWCDDLCTVQYILCTFYRAVMWWSLYVQYILCTFYRAMRWWHLYSTFYVHFAGLCCDDKFCCINALLVCLYCRNIYILLYKPHPLYINGHIYRPATLNRAGKIYNKGYNNTVQRKAKDIITQSRERQRI